MSMILAVQVWKLDLDKTTAWILMALCDSADDDGTHCHATEDYLMWKTHVSRATLYRVFNWLMERRIITRREWADGTVETIIDLAKAPQKAAWKRPKRGGKRAKQKKDSLTARPFESHHETLSVSQRDPLSLTARPFESHGETDTVGASPEPISDEGTKNAPIHPITHPKDPSYYPSSLARSADLTEGASGDVTAPPERRTRESSFDETALRRDPLTLTLIACLGHEPATRREWSQWRIAVNDLHTAGATPDDIPRAIRGYQATYPRARVTPLALVGHWSEIQEGKPHDLAQLEISRRAAAATAAQQAERERANAERKAEEQREVQRLLGEYGYSDCI